MNLRERKQLCRKAWENEYDYLQLGRIAKRGEGKYSFRHCERIPSQNVLPRRNFFGENEEQKQTFHRF